ncbi:MAG: hypothetical protein PHD68_00905 [Rugosibacter sp.]|nr:hypothetical protein [Rugosibacter sp.]
MKKILVIGLISGFFSAGAFAAACDGAGGPQTAGSATPGAGETCVCNGKTAVKSTVNGGKSGVITTPRFLQTGFDVQCSANTLVSYNEVSGVAFAVASGSVKGNRTFKGSTAGGGVAEAGKCPATGCTGATEVSSALTAAVAEATSS